MSQASNTTQLSNIHKAGLLFLFLSLLVFGFGRTLQAASNSVTAVVTQRSVGLHSGAAWGYHVTGKVFQNQQVDVMAHSPNHAWVYVQAGEEAGWAATHTLKLNGSMDSLPVWNAPTSGAKIKPTATIQMRTLGIHSGADWGYHVVGNAERGQQVILMAVSPDRDWYFIWSDAGDGWVPARGLRLASPNTNVPVWTNTMHNAVIKPTAKIIISKLGIRSGAGFGYSVIGTVFSNDEFIMLGRSVDSKWVFIWSDAGDGWVPASSISSNYPIYKLNVWTKQMDSAQLKPTVTVNAQQASIHTGAGFNYNTIGALNKGETVITMAKDATGQWVFIWSDTGDGWVPVRVFVQAGLNLGALPTWPTVIKGGHHVAHGTINWRLSSLRSNNSLSAASYSSLARNQQVTILGGSMASGWLYVSSAYGDGWVDARSVHSMSNLSGLATTGIR